MENKKKKKYVKPEITKIKLDAKCAVLGGCKIGGDDGPNGTGCGFPTVCNSYTS
jgi:uncharacterized ferredoxin-like protein